MTSRLHANAGKRSGGLHGFTLIELLIILVIIGVLGSLGVPGLQKMAANQALASAASGLMSSALEARSTALKLNRRTVLQPITTNSPPNKDDWRYGWRVYVDVNSNGVFDSGTDTVVSVYPAPSADISFTTLTGTGEGGSLGTIGYNGDGFAATINGQNAGSVLMASTLTSRQKYVTVSLVGRPRICDPKLTPGCEP